MSRHGNLKTGNILVPKSGITYQSCWFIAGF